MIYFYDSYWFVVNILLSKMIPFFIFHRFWIKFKLFWKLLFSKLLKKWFILMKLKWNLGHLNIENCPGISIRPWRPTSCSQLQAHFKLTTVPKNNLQLYLVLPWNYLNRHFTRKSFFYSKILRFLQFRFSNFIIFFYDRLITHYHQ